MGFSASPGFCKCGAKLELTAPLGLNLEGTWEADFPPLCSSAVWVLSLSHTAKQREESHPPKARRKLPGDGEAPIVFRLLSIQQRFVFPLLHHFFGVHKRLH